MKKRLVTTNTADSDYFEYLDQIYSGFEKNLSVEGFLSFFQKGFGYGRVAIFSCKSVENCFLVSYINGLNGSKNILLPKKNYELPPLLRKKLQEENSLALDIDRKFQDFSSLELFQMLNRSFKGKILFPLRFRGNLNGFVLGGGIKKEEKFSSNPNILSHFLNLLSLFLENQILFEMVNLDRMTGLYNQHYFKKRLSDELDRTRRYQRPLSLILADLDFFKQVNDSYGHLEGDRVIKEFSWYLRDSVRKVDIVSRYGGEEFTIILPETTLKQAEKVAQKLCYDLSSEDRKVYVNHTEKSFLTASFGVSSSEIQGMDTPSLLLHSADQALYLAKDRGRNQVALYIDLI